MGGMCAICFHPDVRFPSPKSCDSTFVEQLEARVDGPLVVLLHLLATRI